MLYFRRCTCGNIIKYEMAGNPPFECPNCGRDPMAFVEQEYYEGAENMPNIPRVPSTSLTETEETEKPKIDTASAVNNSVKSGFCLVSEDGKEYDLDADEVIVGRDNLCSDYLSKFNEVSREHLKIKKRSSDVSILITDISKYGTLINGKKMSSGETKMITHGAEITLVYRAKLTVKYRGHN